MAEARAHAREATSPVLTVEDLAVAFRRHRGVETVIAGVSLQVWPGEIVGVIGETGSGKSLTALSVLRLLPHGAHVQAGRIELRGRSLLNLPEAEMRALRGSEIAYVPQDASRALNPLLAIGRQVGEPLEIHKGSSLRRAWGRAVETLAAVGIGEAIARAHEYPHQFSGGMQQRALVATALTLTPPLIIADEPTSSLDITVQAQILALLSDIRDRSGTSILFISHDLGVVASLCDWVYVMHKGRIVESGVAKRVFEEPAADYTRMLLAATPLWDQPGAAGDG